MVFKIRKEGITILVIEHHMKFIMELCDAIVVLNFGLKIAEGSPKEIQNSQAVIEAIWAPRRAMIEARNIDVSYGSIRLSSKFPSGWPRVRLLRLSAVTARQINLGKSHLRSR